VTLTDSGLLRITVMDADAQRAGRAFSAAVVETGLAGYPGFYALTPPGNASQYGVHWPILVPSEQVRPRVFLNGEELPQTPPPTSGPPPPPAPAAGRRAEPPPFDLPTVRMPLGRIAGARSGDKGGNANLGVWADTRERYDWLEGHLTAGRLKELLPALAAYRV